MSISDYVDILFHLVYLYNKVQKLSIILFFFRIYTLLSAIWQKCKVIKCGKVHNNIQAARCHVSQEFFKDHKNDIENNTKLFFLMNECFLLIFTVFAKKKTKINENWIWRHERRSYDVQRYDMMDLEYTLDCIQVIRH